MAIVTTVYCDCCGSQFRQNRYKDKYEIRKSVYSGMGNNSKTLGQLDLCDTCREAIDNAIENIFNPPAPEVEEGENNEL